MKNKWPRKIIKKLFRAKKSFHQELARMPFDEKIKILVNLQKIAQNIPGFSKNKQIVWDLE